MVINDELNFIFVHVYRTGGSSMDNILPGTKLLKETHKKLEEVDRWKDYFSFAFVRNPWDRTVSSYMFATKTNKFNGTFEDYAHTFKNQTTKTHAQYNMVKNCSFIGRFETMQDDFRLICKKVGLPVLTLPHIWKTDHKPYAYYYNDELIDIVAKHAMGDIEHFGYSFDSTATQNTGWVG